MEERKKEELIKQISDIINVLIFDKKTFITIINLSLPPKGGVMKVYLSIFPENKEIETLRYLNKFSRRIRNDLKDRIYMRYLPSKIIFYSSNQFSEAQKILELINEIEEKEKNWSKN